LKPVRRMWRKYGEQNPIRITIVDEPKIYMRAVAIYQ
jgi:hypothetical protein